MGIVGPITATAAIVPLAYALARGERPSTMQGIGVGLAVVGVIAALLVVTGLLARCPLYKVIDVDTSVQEQPYSSTDDRAGL